MRENNQNPERILLLIAAGILVFLFVWFQWKLLMLVFAGLLLSVILHAIASWISRLTRLNPLFAYLGTLFILAAILGLAIWLLAPRVISQIIQAAAFVPQALAKASSYLGQSHWGAYLLNMLHKAGRGTGARLPQMAGKFLNATVDLVVIVVIGFFGALDPQGYREGLLALIPPASRDRARILLQGAGTTLRSWLLGQLIPMSVLGVASVIGLWALHVPLAFTLGLMTGLLIFIPYVGSVSSGALAVLFAFQQGSRTALYVFLLYCVFHLCEGYLLTPLVQKEAVRLPPIVTVLSQYFLWSFAGILGVAIAAPLAAVIITTVKNVYIVPQRIGGIEAENDSAAQESG